MLSICRSYPCVLFFFFQAEDGIRDHCVTGVQTCALPILAAMVDLAAMPDRIQRAEADAREEQYGQDDEQDADDGERDDQRPLRGGAARDSRTHFLLLRRAGISRAVGRLREGGVPDGPAVGPPGGEIATCRNVLPAGCEKRLLQENARKLPLKVHRGGRYFLRSLRARRKSLTTYSPRLSGMARSTRPPFRLATSSTNEISRSSSATMKPFTVARRLVILSTSAIVSSSVSGDGGQSNQKLPSRRRCAVGSPSGMISTIGLCSGRRSRKRPASTSA